MTLITGRWGRVIYDVHGSSVERSAAARGILLHAALLMTIIIRNRLFTAHVIRHHKMSLLRDKTFYYSIQKTNI
jgi:hypothetical protein